MGRRLAPGLVEPQACLHPIALGGMAGTIGKVKQSLYLAGEAASARQLMKGPIP